MQCACCIQDEHTCGLYLNLEVLLLIFEFLDLEFFLSVWVESLCSFIYVCFVIFVIVRNIRS